MWAFFDKGEKTDGVSGPNITNCLIFVRDARWANPESLTINVSPIVNSVSNSSIVVSPHRLIILLLLTSEHISLVLNPDLDAPTMTTMFLAFSKSLLMTDI